MTTTIVFAHSLADKVRIIELERPARVVAMGVDLLGVMYKVEYWNDCKRESAWLHDDELAVIP